MSGMGEPTFSYAVAATFTQVRVVLNGELDIGEASAFTADVLAQAAGADVVIEASGLTFCGSAGIASFVRLADAACRTGNSFRMMNVPPNLARLV